MIEMEVKILAGFLLAFRLAAVGFLIPVLKIQSQLFKIKETDLVTRFRLALFIMVLVITLGQILPIAIDFFTLLGISLPYLLFVYAISNAITAALASLALYMIYKFAKKTNKMS